VIPQARISPVGQKILSYFPAETIPGAINTTFVAATNLGRYYYEQPIFRWDHIFDSNNKLSGMYTGQQGYEYRSSTGFSRPAATGNTKQPAAPTKTYRRVESHSLAHEGIGLARVVWALYSKRLQGSAISA